MISTPSSPSQKQVKDPVQANGQDHFNGAAIITEDGREIPITETMLQAAFEQFDASGIVTWPVSGLEITH